MLRTKEHIYSYLIQPSHLFLKQVVKIVETNRYILVLDLRNTKKLFIPDQVIENYENRLETIKKEAFKSSEYDGVKFILVPKS
ncbi:hypothetical protein AAE02nite_12920 [Adhaeribacter aerolatus]|uniref:Uncharacterized protein n=1 Tax=Adhaeribacter aerolatus TaxID=670289 RepID=A0A512AV89_9BACT|nr:hypothetical protein [Adhaeribacter aerolatus]GEO03628.1 hypothetical protein AAE02nite_12920 [Adhaeribacter aerolatus]